MRPFKLYVIPRYATSNYATEIPGGNHKGATVSEIDSSEIRAAVSYNDSANYGYYHLWFDLILALPADKGVITSTGVIIDNVVYPLIASDDYASSITVTISWLQPYWISDYWGNRVYEGTFDYQETLTIPFSGYVDKYTPGESEISFSISRLPGASNINLNSGNTGSRNRTDVAKLDLLVNFSAGDVPEENRDKVRIFLSSSLESDYSGPEFTLLHEDANGIVRDDNSFRYQAIVTSTEGQSQTRAFDGTDYLAADGKINDTWLTTDCHNEDRLLQVDQNYFHFHTFSGIVSIEVSDENDSKTMLAGRYESRIYVHVVVDE